MATHRNNFHNGETVRAQSRPEDEPIAETSSSNQPKRKRPQGMDYDEIVASEDRRNQLRRSKQKLAKREQYVDLVDEPSDKVARIFGPILERLRGKHAFVRH